MTEMTITEIEAGLARGQRLMGLDLGTKTIGLALSDTTRRIGSPWETLRRTKFTADAERLTAMAAEQNVGGLVYGLPVNMDGTEGPRCQSTRQFARNLAAILPLPYSFQDERMSTQAVERVLIDEVDMTRQRRAEVVDKAAAAWILQGALDSI
jgi:putative Holliday junction resolvase